MTNKDFWDSIQKIIKDDYNPKGLTILEDYADKFINGKQIFKRFSPREQQGCAEGGQAHVIATIIAGAENSSDPITQGGKQLKGIFQLGAQQAALIERWARNSGMWIENLDQTLISNMGNEIAEGGEAKVYDSGSYLVKSIGLDYFILPIHALDRISLHNAYFPETKMEVIGFGRDSRGDFRILVSQPFIEGIRMTDKEIEEYLHKMGFKLQNPRNWTYITPEIYLSDMHDENVIKDYNGTVYVLDCDIRLNTPDLNKGGIREFSNIVLDTPIKSPSTKIC